MKVVINQFYIGDTMKRIIVIAVISVLTLTAFAQATQRVPIAELFTSMT